MNQKAIEASILGQTYLLTCAPDEEGALRAAVKRVNEEMEMIRETGKIKAKERIAVLACLNLAHALGRSRLTPIAASQTSASSDQLTEESRQKIEEIVNKLDKTLESSGLYSS